MQTYRPSHLDFLQQTQQILSYHSNRKRNHKNQTRLTPLAHSYQQDSRWGKSKNATNSPAEKGSANYHNDFAHREIKRRLTACLKQTKEIVEADPIYYRKSQNINNEYAKKGELFRVTTFRRPSHHKCRSKQEEMHSLESYAQLDSQFRVRQACLQPRFSVNNPKVYQHLGISRNFLKEHGEYKCFQKSIKFNQYKSKSINNPSSPPSKHDQPPELSLEYSSDGVEHLQVEGWKKMGSHDMQWQMGCELSEN